MFRNSLKDSKPWYSRFYIHMRIFSTDGKADCFFFVFHCFLRNVRDLLKISFEPQYLKKTTVFLFRGKLKLPMIFQNCAEL